MIRNSTRVVVDRLIMARNITGIMRPNSHIGCRSRFAFAGHNAHLFHSSAPTLKEDYYSVLGVPKSASKSDIKKKYFEMAKKYHPGIRSFYNIHASHNFWQM
jgi:DnaJ-domain-containing protein 1